MATARAACARPEDLSAEVGPREAVGAPTIGGEIIALVSSPERRGAVSHSDITAKKQELGPPPSVRLHADSRPHWPDHFGRCLPLPEQLLIELNLLFPASGWANNKLGRRGLTWILDPRPLPWNLRVRPTSDSLAPPYPSPFRHPILRPLTHPFCVLTQRGYPRGRP